MKLATVLDKSDFASATNYRRSIMVEKLHKIRDTDSSGYRATIVTARGERQADQIGELTEEYIDDLEAALFRVTNAKLDWE